MLITTVSIAALVAAIIALLSFLSVHKLVKETEVEIENISERLDVLDEREEREKKPAQPYRDPATGKETPAICADCRYCSDGVAALICRANPVAPKPGYKTPHFKVCAIVNKNRDCPDFKPKAP
jgi:hypothetical protein